MTAWHVYLVRCGDASLYTGIAIDVERRLEEHRSGRGRGAKYLRGRGPLQVEFTRRVGSQSTALRVERQIKRLPRREKERLIAGSRCLQPIVARARKA